jgi:multiple sugar transport system substrate-binding protein
MRKSATCWRQWEKEMQHPEKKSTHVRRGWFQRASRATGRVLPAVALTLCAITPIGARAHQAADKITLTYWDDDTFSVYQKQLDPIMQAFTKTHPNVTVKIVHGENVQKLLTAVASGTAPDVFQFWDGPEPLGSLAGNGALLNLSPLIKSTHFNIADLLPTAMQSVTYGTQVYGLPWNCGSYNYFYNMADFKTAGITSTPATLSQLWADSRKLTITNSNNRITRLGQVPPNGNWQVYAWIENFGGSLYKLSTHQVTPDNPGVIAALNDLAAQYKAYGPSNIDRFSSSLGQSFSPNDPLFNGLTAMRLDGDWQAFNFGIYKPLMKYGRDWGSFTVPYPDGHPERSLSSSLNCDDLAAMAGTSHPQEAFDFLTYMTTGDAAVVSAIANSDLPTSKKVLNDPRIAKLNFYKLDVHVMLQSPRLLVFPVTPVSQHYSDVFNADLSLILHGKETALAGMQHVKKVIQPELDQFYSTHPGQK